ncbi:hypothetical protein VTK26DRAFT_3953 [Humicola hyalothermophila]
MSSSPNGAEATASTDSVMQFFTAREQQLIIHALVCMKDFPTINYEKIADRMGLKNPRSVANAWGALKKKILTFDKEERKRKGLPSDDEDDEAAACSDGKATPKTPKRRAPRAASGTPGSGKRARTTTPKTARGKKGSLLAAADAGPQDEEQEEAAKNDGVKMEGAQDRIKPEPEAETAEDNGEN